MVAITIHANGAWGSDFICLQQSCNNCWRLQSRNNVDDMIRMNIHPNPDLSMHWSECPVKLPAELEWHSSVLYNDHLMVTGGDDRNAASDCIREVQLVPPYTVKTLSRMPEPRQDALHGNIR